MIERRNILGLIGKHRGKYHSCVLTCYSFDFSFFEERVLPTLRTANIKNVNVLADGPFLEQAQERTTGKEFRHNKTYNFQPIFERGVFHPKIMLLTGVKHGLLIIGSGNMTSSGLSTNDEIWGAFHLDNLENENAPLFSQVWDYLQTFLRQSKGFVTQKIEWITKYSPWLNELPKTSDWINISSSKLDLRFIGNNPSFSTYQQILKLVPKENIKTITVISPYYDKKGVIIKQLYLDFNPEKFHCIVDSNAGLLPKDLSSDISDKILFHDWSTCKKDYQENFNRLHAKMIHFHFNNGEEYLLLGSANATLAAMGSSTLKASNAEAGLLLKRHTSKNWLNELQINIPSISIDLKDLGNANGINVDSIPKIHYKHRIVYTELRGNEIRVFLKDSEFVVPLSIVVVNQQGISIAELEGKREGATITAKLSDTEHLFKIYLKDESGNRISNYSIVHRLAYLLRCNPDPNHEKLDALLSEDYPDGEGVTSLLQFIDYNWADEDNVAPNSVARISTNSSNNNAYTLQEIDYEKLTAEEFNKVSDVVLLKQQGELSNSNIKIAEFLGIYTSGIVGKDDDFTESTEQKLLEDIDQQGEGAAVQNNAKRKVHATKEKQAILKYFKKLDKIFSDKLSSIFKAKALSVSPKEPITIKLLSNILIGLQLIQIYQGKKYTLQSKDLAKISTVKESYLPDGHLKNEVGSVKGFLINVFGKFLLLATAGMKEYDYEILRQKLSTNQNQIVVKSIFIILNLNWRSNEKKYKETLILNTLFFISSKEKKSNTFIREFCTKLLEQKNRAKYIATSFDDNYRQLQKELLPNYEDWQKKFMNQDLRKEKLIIETHQLQKGSILFNSKIGFNYVLKAYPSSPIKLDLTREGYLYNETSPILEKIAFGNKCVKYK